MKRYYFYAHSLTPNWYTLTTDVLREQIEKSQDETGNFTNPFPVTFIFVGKYTEAPDKDTAENNYRNKINLIDCKEPACMLTARRKFFEQQHANLMI